jgi:hypothetical protein
MLVIMVFRQTLFPVPVAPAIRRCGMRARSAMKGSPWIFLPSARVSLCGEEVNFSEARRSLKAMISRRLFGTSMPTVDFPETRSIRADSAWIARQRSSDSDVILLYFTPASGLNSKVVTTGPGWIWTTWPATWNSWNLEVMSLAVSISSRSSTACSSLPSWRSDSGGGT